MIDENWCQTRGVLSAFLFRLNGEQAKEILEMINEALIEENANIKITNAE